MENIYEYFAQFRRAAKNTKWPKERIDAVLTEARSDDYEHALCVLLAAMNEIEGCLDGLTEPSLGRRRGIGSPPVGAWLHPWLPTPSGPCSLLSYRLARHVRRAAARRSRTAPL